MHEVMLHRARTGTPETNRCYHIWNCILAGVGQEGARKALPNWEMHNGNIQRTNSGMGVGSRLGVR
jgi:hypothetical protein